MRNIFQTIKGIITSPTEFFKSVSYDRGIADAFIFLLIIDFILILSIVFNPSMWLFLPPAANLFIATFMGLGALIGVIVSMCFMLLGALVLNFLFHLFKGKGTYKDTFNLLAYSSFPFLIGAAVASLLTTSTFIFGEYAGIAILILMLPLIIIRFGAFIWYAFLMVIGGSIVHKISKVESLLAGVIIPFIVGSALGASILVIIVIIGFALGI